MAKIRKVQRKKKFKYSNKKRLNKRSKKRKKIECATVQAEWDQGKSIKENLETMGLTYDVNNKLQKNLVTGEKPAKKKKTPKKEYVAKQLEEEANTFRGRNLRLPNGEVIFLSYLLDKYGEDYKAMVKDKKNLDQLTWKQIRAKIKTFKSIPEQFNEYLKNSTRMDES